MTTGCLRIVKESAFTGLNNYRTDSILSYDDEVYFGFTEDEIISILDEYNMQIDFPPLKTGMMDIFLETRKFIIHGLHFSLLMTQRINMIISLYLIGPILQVIILSITSSGSQIQH